MCSLAARGLWIEMLGLMHESEPYGHLLVCGKAPTDIQLAVLVGAPLERLSDYLGELESTGVFSRTQKGVIYSRRLTREAKRSQTARKNGKTGGNPTLNKQRVIPPSDNLVVKPPDKPQKPEAISKIEIKNLIPDLRATRAFDGPDYSDKAVRKARWRQKVIAFAQRTLPAIQFRTWMVSASGDDAESVRALESMNELMQERERATA